MGLLPGVSTILRVLNKPALTNWLQEQAILSALTLPRERESFADWTGRCRAAGHPSALDMSWAYDNPPRFLDDEHEFALRVIEDMGKEAETARDLGSEIHASVAALLSGREDEVSDDLLEYVLPVEEALKAHKILWTERVLVGEGFAGTADIGTHFEDGYTLFDVKTCKELPKAPWPEHRLQLAAYAEAARRSEGWPRALRVANIYLSKAVPGQMVIHYHEDWMETYAAFEHLLNLWRWMNGFYP